VLPAHIGRRHSGRVLLQHLDDLLFGKSALAHVRLPKERTLPKIGDIYGEQVTMYNDAKHWRERAEEARRVAAQLIDIEGRRE
jgi:hypothetical protein